MSLPAEFDDVLVGLEAVPEPSTEAPADVAVAVAEEQPVTESNDALLAALLPQAREATEPRMGVPATDLPPMPTPELPELGPGSAPGAARDLRLLADVNVELAVEIGRVKLPLRDLLSLGPGVVLELDRAADAPVDILVNGCLVARGEVVVIDGSFGVRVTAVVER
jgi:flagellar motor switch protein FliN/FliY